MSFIEKRSGRALFIYGVSSCCIALFNSPAVAQAALQPAAELSAIPTGNSLKDLPLTINTLDLVAKSNFKNGVSVTVWRYSTKYGEGGCDQGSGTVGMDAKTCPRFGLLVSTRWELEDNSKFSLWSVSDRQWWRVDAPVGSKKLGAFDASGTSSTLLLYACEASAKVEKGVVNPSAADNWHAVPYRLEIAQYNQVSLKRLPDAGPQQNCFGNNTPPRDPAKNDAAR